MIKFLKTTFLIGVLLLVLFCSWGPQRARADVTPTPTGTATPSAAASDYLIQITPPTSVPASLRSLQDAIPRIFDIVIYSAAIVFLILFLIGGVQYLASAGNEETSGKAKKLLIDAVVGMVIVVMAWAAGTWILSVFGIDIIK